MNLSMRIQMFFRSFFLQTGWNFLRYQNIGLSFVMLPFLRKLYKEDPDALPSVLQRYLDTFNTQPVMASFCFGAMAKQEEEIAKAKTLTEFKTKVTEWTSTRRGLAITTASIGDRLFWGTLKPLTLLMALFIWLLLGVNFFEVDLSANPPLLYVFCAGGAALFAFNAIALFVKWEGLKLSYRGDENSCFGLTRFDWNKTIYNAKRIGIVLAVGMILFGLYHFLKDLAEIDVHFIARALLVLCFVLLSFVTRKLRIPNMYLYLAVVVIFNLICLL